MKKTVLFVAVLLFLYSCEKEGEFTIENTNIPLIIRVMDGGEIVKVYTYNDANLLVEESSKFNYTGHHYNERNQLVRSEFYMDPAMWSSNMSVIQEAMSRKEWVSPGNTEKTLTQTFDYNGNGQLYRKTYTRPLIDNSNYSEFTWEEDRIIRQSMYWNGKMSVYIDYFYDSSGNLYKELKYRLDEGGIPKPETTTEYEFDNMKNPLLAFRRLMRPGEYTNHNNIIKQKYTIHFEVPPGIDQVTETSYSYEYNKDGYPVRVNDETEYIYKK